MRKILITFTLIIYAIAGYSQSYDERVAKAMNAGDWFALDSIYNAAPKDSIWSFLDVYSRCLIGNRLNRPDVSIPAFTELFNTQSEQLDLGNMLNSAMMFSMDLSRIGDNTKAGAVLSSILNATKPYLDSLTINNFQNYIAQYNALSSYSPYTIKFTDDNGVIPFRTIPVGKPENKSVLMQLENASINGSSAVITFDTGAGTNVISDSLARKFDLISLDVETKVAGADIHTGTFAIAKELKIGNITVYDVPFTVMNITSNYDEADQYMDCFNIILGSELMLQLKDLTIDFINNQITVPVETPIKTDIPSNMCFSSQMNFLAKGVIHNDAMLMCIDSGDASFGSLGSHFFSDNKDFITTHSQLDSIRSAGIGGVHISECYKVPDLELKLGGQSVIIPKIDVLLQDAPYGYDCNLGLKTLMLFAKVRFNLVDFVLTTESRK